MNPTIFLPTLPLAALFLTLRRFAVGAMSAVLLVVLAACGGGGGGSGSATLSGVAATGAAIAGQTVTVKNAAGTTATALTGTDGSFTVTISASAPYVLSVVDGNNVTWYSYAPASGTVHINPMTTLALLSANGNAPLDELMTNWASSTLSEAAVLEAAKKVNANLQSVFIANGINDLSTNIFNAFFEANGTGLDAVLDDLNIGFSCDGSVCTQTIQNIASLGSPTTITWNNAIDTTGFTISWTTGGSSGGGNSGGNGGSGSVTVGQSCSALSLTGPYALETSTSGITTCIDGLSDRPTTQNEFCSDSLVNSYAGSGGTVSITGCSFSGNQGSISTQISAPTPGGPIPFTITTTYTYYSAAP